MKLGLSRSNCPLVLGIQGIARLPLPFTALDTYPVPMAQSHTRFVRPAQLVALLLSFLAASALIGVVSAGVLVPAVGTGAITAKAGMEIFDEIPTDIQVVSPATESTMLDTNGQVIARFYDKQRIVIPSDKIALVMKKAIVAIEDRRFFEHHGVDPTGIARAMVNNLGDDGGKQGASTITQQYVRNALAEKGYMEGDADQVEAATEQTTERKLREIKYALAVEKQMDKDQILTGYLNIAPFGPITYGVEAASKLYFSKSASELSTGEAALLAGLVQSPVQYNPLQHPEAAQERRDTVLSVMADQGIITEQEEAEAKAVSVSDMLHPTQIREGCSGAGDENAYFCSYAVRQFLADEAFGKTSIERERLLKTGGLTIRTTLDPKKQHAAYESLTKTIPSNDASGLDDALVSLVPQTGEVVAMAQNTVYGVGEDETMSNYSADGSFQVGSTFKVFVLAEWYKEGRSGYETIDGRTNFPNGSFKCDGEPVHTESWNVVDLAGKDGAFNVIGATGLSVNHSFVNMASKLNFCNIFQVAADMGIDDGNGEPILAVPGNILGSGSASPLTMARAFATFVNDGKMCQPYSIAKVTDRQENVLKEGSANCKQVIDSEVAQKVATTLTKSASQYYTATRLSGGRQFAAKSGTTDYSANTWLTGSTAELTTAAWVGHGNASTTPVQNVRINGRYYSRIFGETFVGQNIWAPYMSTALEGTPNKPMPNANIGAPQAVTRATQAPTPSATPAAPQNQGEGNGPGDDDDEGDD